MTIPIDSFPNVPSLNYSELRKHIRSGDILLCSGSAVFSHLIQQVTHSVWSHVAFILRLDIIDRVMVLESVEDIGVRTIPLSAYVNNYHGTGKGYPGKVLIIRHTQFNPANIINLSKHAVDLLGYPYDKAEILRIATRITSRALGMTLPPETVKQDHAYICSEYAYTCYKSVGITIDYDPEGFVTPADFAKTPEIQPVNFIQIT